MELKNYLFLRRLSVTEAAKELDVSREWLSQIMHKKKIAGRVLAQRIEEWSEGAVKPGDLWKV